MISLSIVRHACAADLLFSANSGIFVLGGASYRSSSGLLLFFFSRAFQQWRRSVVCHRRRRRSGFSLSLAGSGAISKGASARVQLRSRRVNDAVCAADAACDASGRLPAPCARAVPASFDRRRRHRRRWLSASFLPFFPATAKG